METVEMRAFAAYGCVVCGSADVVATITVERDGQLRHYPSCRRHMASAAARVVGDLPAEPEPAPDVLVRYPKPLTDGPDRALQGP